jgi:phosphoribosylamine-glycine ligase
MEMSIIGSNDFVECLQISTNYKIKFIPIFKTPFRYSSDKELYEFYLKQKNVDLFLYNITIFSQYKKKHGLKDILSYDNIFFPTVKHRKLEMDRIYGKEVTSDLSLNNPKYFICNQHNYKTIKEIFKGKVVVKEINDHMLTMGDTDEIISFLKNYYKNNTEQLLIEECIDYDVAMSISFMVNKDKVVPVCLVFDEDFLFPNKMGNKVPDVGNVICSEVPQYLQDYFIPKLKKWTTKVDYVGWLDVDFFLKDGKIIVFEYMCRFAYPTISSIMKLACCDWADIFYRFLHGADITKKDFQWKHKYAVSYGMFTMPNSNNSAFIGSLPIGEHVVNYKDFFIKSPKVQSQHFTSLDVYNNGNSLRIAQIPNVIGGRIGMAIGTDDNWKLAKGKALEIAETISYINKIYKLDIFENTSFNFDRMKKVYNNFIITDWEASL